MGCDLPEYEDLEDRKPTTNKTMQGVEWLHTFG